MQTPLAIGGARFSAHHHGAASSAFDDSEGEIEAAFASMNVKAVGLYRKRCLAQRGGEHASTSRDTGNDRTPLPAALTVIEHAESRLWISEPPVTGRRQPIP
jgi:hypothetical protein